MYRGGIFKLIVLLVIMGACKPGTVNTVDDHHEMQVENAEWLYFEILSNEEVEKKGKYHEGYKLGKWTYALSGKEEKSIEWQIYNSEEFALIYPDIWNIATDTNYLFLASDEDSISYLMAATVKKEDLSELQYLSNFYHYSKTAYEGEHLVEASAKMLTTPTDKKQIFYNLIFSNGQDNWLALGMIVSKGNQLYHLMYRKEEISRDNHFWDEVFFTEIINNVFINQERVVVSTKNYAKIESIELD